MVTKDGVQPLLILFAQPLVRQEYEVNDTLKDGQDRSENQIGNGK